MQTTRLIVRGIRYDGNDNMEAKVVHFTCYATNDSKGGRTLSINDGKVQFTVPFEPLDKFLRKDNK